MSVSRRRNVARYGSCLASRRAWFDPRSLVPSSPPHPPPASDAIVVWFVRFERTSVILQVLCVATWQQTQSVFGSEQSEIHNQKIIIQNSKIHDHNQWQEKRCAVSEFSWSRNAKGARCYRQFCSVRLAKRRQDVNEKKMSSAASENGGGGGAGLARESTLWEKVEDKKAVKFQPRLWWKESNVISLSYQRVRVALNSSLGDVPRRQWSWQRPLRNGDAPMLAQRMTEFLATCSQDRIADTIQRSFFDAVVQPAAPLLVGTLVSTFFLQSVSVTKHILSVIHTLLVAERCLQEPPYQWTAKRCWKHVRGVWQALLADAGIAKAIQRCVGHHGPNSFVDNAILCGAWQSAVCAGQLRPGMFADKLWQTKMSDVCLSLVRACSFGFTTGGTCLLYTSDAADDYSV